jgi:hypothetical protein
MIIKSLRKLKLCGVKLHKHCGKLKKHRSSLPFDVFKCPSLILSAFVSRPSETGYELMIYKPSTQINL